MPRSDEQIEDSQQSQAATQDRLSPTQESTDKILRRFHHHSISDSSAVESTDSSPTTTISTVDDSSATEPSPGSSPESPPPSSFTGGGLHRPRTANDARPFFELQKQPPPRKGRNLKNLAVNTSRNTGRGLSTASLPLPNANSEDLSSVASPAFVKPPTPSKRKPSNLGLTLLTPGTGKPPLQEIRLAIPPTPSFGRPGTLRHFQSSPSLSLFPGLGSKDDAAPHPLRAGTTLETIMSPAVETNERPFEAPEEENFDVPLSQEEKPEAYPDGPICVYEPYIDLYLEPTVEQAREYDVIMNVASEVRNPFNTHVQAVTVEPEIRIDGGGGIQYAPKRDRISQKRSEQDSTFDGSPTTPKATPLEASFKDNDTTPRAQKEPEYIHIMWEHNSDIVPDLLRLVKLIDDKVVSGERVLVHCQCGVSRSASLVVAYGLYKDPSLSVQEAYDAVKKRSKWIGPNMNLIMQLQEFRSSLMHGGMLSANRMLTPITPGSALSEWKGPFASNALSPSMTRANGVSSTIRSQTAEAPPTALSGPSSAPLGQSAEPIPTQRARAASAMKPGTPYMTPARRVTPKLPVLKVVDSDAKVQIPRTLETTTLDDGREGSSSTTPTEAAKPESTADFALAPLQPSPEVDAADSFGLMSPTTTGFSSSPFDRDALLARLGMNPVDQPREVAPRRSASLRAKNVAKSQDGLTLPNEQKQAPRLRIKVSSPDLREQQQLQSLRAGIEASQRSAQSLPPDPDDTALMSPRVTEFTQNPFAFPVSTPATPATAASTDSDPRSPVQEKGVSPITRNIFDVL